MKKVRQRGDFTIDLNKFTADSLTMRFDENIGDLRTFLQNENIFRAVNLDDPLYKQRESSLPWTDSMPRTSNVRHYVPC